MADDAHHAALDGRPRAPASVGQAVFPPGKDFRMHRPQDDALFLEKAQRRRSVGVFGLTARRAASNTLKHRAPPKKLLQDQPHPLSVEQVRGPLDQTSAFSLSPAFSVKWTRVGGTTGVGFLIGSAAGLRSLVHHATRPVCCCCCCGHVGDAAALSKRSVMSTALSASGAGDAVAPDRHRRAVAERLMRTPAVVES